jgi:hypothetical protein
MGVATLPRAVVTVDVDIIEPDDESAENMRPNAAAFIAAAITNCGANLTDDDFRALLEASLDYRRSAASRALTAAMCRGW